MRHVALNDFDVRQRSKGRRSGCFAHQGSHRDSPGGEQAHQHAAVQSCSAGHQDHASILKRNLGLRDNHFRFQSLQLGYMKQPVVELRRSGPPAGPEAPHRAGVRAVSARLYRATYQRVFATLMLTLRNPAAAEDATQEASLRAFRGWDRWKQDAPAEAWIYRIALNVAFTHRRRARLHDAGDVLRRLGRPKEPDPPQLGEPIPPPGCRPLPPKQAAALVLRHLHGFTNREIATALNVPERTVASRLAAAKARLRGRLEARSKIDLGTPVASTVSLEE